MKFLFHYLIILVLFFSFESLLSKEKVIFVRFKQGVDFSQFEKLKNSNSIISQQKLMPESISFSEKYRKVSQSLLPEKIINIIQKEEPLLRTIIVEFENNLSSEQFCTKLLKENPNIEIAEPYYEMELLEYKPNDEMILNQVDLLNNIKAFDAWEVYQGDTNVVIGISDSGLDQNHNDLKDNIAINYGEIPNDNIDNDENGYVDDYLGYNLAFKEDNVNPSVTINYVYQHGCEVGGIAGARTDNQIGIAGIGFKSKIFPIKIMAGNSLKYSYQSLIYAASRGLKVLNCSWGAPVAYSSINQSIIDYAVANDVAIIAAGGNKGTNGATIYDTFYPAAYKGVLGVGETYYSDVVTDNSVMGVQTRIMAPGVNNWATRNNNQYTSNTSGTSYSSPVVSGAVALARGKHPELSAMQALEFVRQCTDNILEVNSMNKSLIPGRLNLYKVVSNNPFSIPAIHPEKVNYFTEDGLPTTRFKENEKAKMNIDFKNYLGKATNLIFTLSVAYDPANSIEVLDSLVTLNEVLQESTGTFGDFTFLVKYSNKSRVIFRVDVSADNDYKDFFKFEFVPSSEMALIANNNIKISVSDDGEIGFRKSGTMIEGQGISFGNYGNQIYSGSGLMATSALTNLAYVNNDLFQNDFAVIKDYSYPDPNTSIIDDSNMGSRRIGLEITQKWGFIDANINSISSDITIKNVTTKAIQLPAVGYYIDWDLGGTLTASKNHIKLIENGIPDNYKGEKSAALMVEIVDSAYPVFGMAVKSDDSDAIAQAAGLHYGITSDFNNEERILSLNSGKTWIVDTVYDVSMAMGMQWKNNLLPNESKKCKICIAFGENQQKLEKELKNCINGFVSVESGKENKVNIYPNPAKNTLNILIGDEINGLIDYSIYSIEGKLLINQEKISANYNLEIDINQLKQGIYMIKIQNGKEAIWKMFIKE